MSRSPMSVCWQALPRTGGPCGRSPQVEEAKTDDRADGPVEAGMQALSSRVRKDSAGMNGQLTLGEQRRSISGGSEGLGRLATTSERD